MPADDVVPHDHPAESALLIICPTAEKAVGPQRTHYDRAAQVGVPAHVTVVYPFKSTELLTDDDDARLQLLFARSAPFTLVGAGTAWFGHSVVFVSMEDPGPIIGLTEAVARAFPEFRPYGGAHPEVVPHLTIGHDQELATLREAEQRVQAQLPFVQPVTEVQLWSGPALASGRGPWRRARSYRLGPDLTEKPDSAPPE